MVGAAVVTLAGVAGAVGTSFSHLALVAKACFSPNVTKLEQEPNLPIVEFPAKAFEESAKSRIT